MGIFQQKTPLEKELDALNKREKKFLTSRQEKEDTVLNQFLADKVPPNLQATLDNAFFKAFQLIFEKGTGVIEKTYRREDLEKNFQVKEFSHETKGTRKTLKAFSKGANSAGNKGMFLSGASGIGMGLLGVGIPDIPVFTGMILRTVYEIALGYGFHYDTEEEQYFILLLIQGAVSHGTALDTVNAQVNRYIRELTLPPDYNKDDQIRQTAGALSKELLYMKFLQGIPLVGAVGGVYDVVYMKNITEYAKIKYQRRFLRTKK
jgi:hypothetical protein